MIRAVADSNVYVSAIRFGGKPEQLLRAAEDGRCFLVVSEAMLLEIAEVFSRKFAWGEDRVANSVERIRSVAHLTVPTVMVAECVDPDDDRILEAAISGDATPIVSGDKHLLRMREFRGLRIVRVAEFLDLLDLAAKVGRDA